MLNEQQVQAMIEEVIPCKMVHVEGDGHHFFAHIVSDAFSGKNRLARHRMIKEGLKDKIASNELHALSITAALTEQEWQEKQR